jgi:hypothetical protein
MDALDEKMKNLEEKLASAPSADVNARIVTLEGKLNSLNNGMPNMIATAISEIEEKKEKRNNLVLVGVHEESNEDLKKWVQDVGKTIDESVDWDSAIKDAKRNGRNPTDFAGKVLPKIIKLYFNDRDARKIFLSKYKSYALDTEDLKHSFCRIDMTYNERMKDKNLRAQVRQLAANGDKSWVVRNLRIVRKSVRRSPTPSESTSDR